MKTNKNNYVLLLKKKSGSAFVTVMILSAVLMIAGLSMTYLTSNATFSARKLHTGARALSIAEAGIADQLTKMSTNAGSGYNYWASGVTNLGTNFDGGTFSVSVYTPPLQNNHIVTSVGTVNGESRITVLELLEYPEIDGALIARGHITLDTSAMTINGDVFAGGNVYNSQGNPNVNGDISAHGGTIEVNGTGTEDPNGPAISEQDVWDSMANELPFPVVSPFTAYMNMASNGGIYRSTSTNFSGVAINPGNGIVYVNGDATISGRSSLNGILVAKGSITIDNQFNGQTMFNTNWTVSLLAGWNVSCDNRNNFGGMIFAGNDLTMSNNRDIRGKMVAMNNIFVRNRGVITPPPTTNPANPEVIIGGWLR